MSNSDNEYIEHLRDDMGEGIKDFISEREAMFERLHSKMADVVEEQESEKEYEEKTDPLTEMYNERLRQQFNDLVKKND